MALLIDASSGVQATQIACPPLCIGDRMLVWAKKIPEDGERGETEHQHAVQNSDHDGRIDQAQTQRHPGYRQDRSS
jgi:hypothetical protein